MAGGPTLGRGALQPAPAFGGPPRGDGQGVQPSNDFRGSTPLVSKEAIYEDAHAGAAAGGGSRALRSRRERQRVALWRQQLRLLSATVWRRAVQLPLRQPTDEDLLQAGLQHRD